MNSSRLSLPKGSLKRAILWIIVFKLGFVVLLKLGLLGREQTKGIQMQLPAQQVQDALLGQSVKFKQVVTHQPNKGIP